MQRIYHKYTEWEDYQNGMFFPENHKDCLIDKCINLLSNESLFSITCNEVVKNWIVCTEENLTNKYCNRRAWLGQASCCYKYNAPEYTTRIAWSKLTDKQRIKANIIANKIIRSYEINYRTIHKGLGEQMLFKWNT